MPRQWFSCNNVGISPKSTRGSRIVQTRKVSSRDTISHVASISVGPSEDGASKRISFKSRTLSTHSETGQTIASLTTATTEETSEVLRVPPLVLEEEPGILSLEMIPRCASPTSDLRCSGDSYCPNSPTLRPSVVCSYLLHTLIGSYSYVIRYSFRLQLARMNRLSGMFLVAIQWPR